MVALKHISFTEILDLVYSSACEDYKKDKGITFLKGLNDKHVVSLKSITDNIESFKAVAAVLTTCLLKKIENPQQDIRLHKKVLTGGYSGRTLDTEYVTPFFKKRFRRYAMKESGWLTRSLEQAHAFTLGFPGKIRNISVKSAFLYLLDEVEKGNVKPDKLMQGLFLLLIQKLEHESKELTIISSPTKEDVTINVLIECLKEHFFSRYNVSGASKLPVIALYSIYQVLTLDLPRFKDKKLSPLKSHISADSKAKGVGDIELLTKKGQYFEAIEVKHGIPVDADMVRDAFEKFKKRPIERYYILTTAEPNIKSGSEKEVKEIIEQIKQEHGCEVIVNGLIHSLKYYLRLIPQPGLFVWTYTRNLEAEFKASSEIKEEHMRLWGDILKKRLNR
ncbi:MAG: DNA methyltransferase [Nanoarchaeota archaeon]|nr:DNA methyltransferase [Nanoarchaeota archaeon]